MPFVFRDLDHPIVANSGSYALDATKPFNREYLELEGFIVDSLQRLNHVLVPGEGSQLLEELRILLIAELERLEGVKENEWKAQRESEKHPSVANPLTPISFDTRKQILYFAVSMRSHHIHQGLILRIDSRVAALLPLPVISWWGLSIYFITSLGGPLPFSSPDCGR